MSRRAAAALAAGTMVAGLVPSPEPAPAPRRRPARPANGAQLAMWRQQAIEAHAEVADERRDNRSRRQATWWKWTIGWARKKEQRTKLRRPRRSRIELLKSQGRPVSGRQWVKLRKALRRQEHAA